MLKEEEEEPDPVLQSANLWSSIFFSNILYY